jgi:hypothetical protein
MNFWRVSQANVATSQEKLWDNGIWFLIKETWVQIREEK